MNLHVAQTVWGLRSIQTAQKGAAADTIKMARELTQRFQMKMKTMDAENKYSGDFAAFFAATDEFTSRLFYRG